MRCWLALQVFGFIGAAEYMLNGFLPDMSVKINTGVYWTTSVVGGNPCTFNCSSPVCIDSTRKQAGELDGIWNITQGSPDGPVQFHSCPLYSPTQPTVEYQPSDTGNGWTNGNICGGNNCFANRCSKVVAGACNYAAVLLLG